MSEVPERFSLGQVVASPAAMSLLRTNGIYPNSLLSRHVRGDWGETDAGDIHANEMALHHGGRLLSVYAVGGAAVWVITEADRSVTTILLPSDY